MKVLKIEINKMKNIGSNNIACIIILQQRSDKITNKFKFAFFSFPRYWN